MRLTLAQHATTSMATEDSDSGSGESRTTPTSNTSATTVAGEAEAEAGRFPELGIPSEEELINIATQLRCFQSPHPRPKCAHGACKISTDHLLARGYLVTGNGSQEGTETAGGAPPQCFTPLLVLHAASAPEALPDFDISIIQGLLQSFAPAGAGERQAASFLAAVNRVTGRLREAAASGLSAPRRPAEGQPSQPKRSLSPFALGDGYRRREEAPAAVVAAAPPLAGATPPPPQHREPTRDRGAPPLLPERPIPPGRGAVPDGFSDLCSQLAQYVRALPQQTAQAVSTAWTEQQCITLETNLAATNMFHGHTTPGKEDFATWQQEFDDRAARLRWSDRFYVMHYIASWEGPAKKALIAHRAAVEFTSAARMFIDDREALVDWASRLYGAKGASFVCNFRDLDVQLKGEKFLTWYYRSTAEKQRFLKVHREYLLSQITTQLRFLKPGRSPRREGDEEFGRDDDDVMSRRKQELLRLFPDAHWAVEDPEFLDLLATWRVQDKQVGFDGTPPAEWERHVLTQQWIDACYKIPDGMHASKAREEAYKLRDRVFRTVTLVGKAGRKAIDDMIQKLHLIDDRVRGAATIFNTRTILAVEQSQAEEAGVHKISVGKDGKLKKKRRTGVAEVSEQGTTNQPESEPEEGEAQVAGIGDRRELRNPSTSTRQGYRMGRDPPPTTGRMPFRTGPSRPADRPVCYSCRKPGHLQRDCTNPKAESKDDPRMKCTRCFRPSHTADDCFAITTATGVELNELTVDLDTTDHLNDLQACSSPYREGPQRGGT